MKISIVKQNGVLIGAYGSDLDIIKKLKLNEVYAIDIKPERNPKFHKKYMALIKLGFNNLPEQYENLYPSIYHFRKAVEAMAGHCEITQTLDGEKIVTSKSIAFEKVDDLEFQQIYKGVYNVLVKYIFPDIEDAEIEEQIAKFM